MNLPEPGSLWQKGERRARVRAVDQRRVLLEHDEGMDEVPTYAWPNDWELVPGAEEGQERAPIVAMLVGGETGRHFDRLRDLAKDLGIDLQFHWSGDVRRPPKKLPAEVELVIILGSHASHSVHIDPAMLLSRKHGIPYVTVQSGGFRNEIEEKLHAVWPDRYGSMGGESRTVSSDTFYVWTGEVWEAAEEEPKAEGGGEGPLAAFVAMVVIALFGGR